MPFSALANQQINILAHWHLGSLDELNYFGLPQGKNIKSIAKSLNSGQRGRHVRECILATRFFCFVFLSIEKNESPSGKTIPEVKSKS